MYNIQEPNFSGAVGGVGFCFTGITNVPLLKNLRTHKSKSEILSPNLWSKFKASGRNFSPYKQTVELTIEMQRENIAHNLNTML